MTSFSKLDERIQTGSDSKEETLLSVTRDRKMWRDIIYHALKGHDT